MSSIAEWRKIRGVYAIEALEQMPMENLGGSILDNLGEVGGELISNKFSTYHI